MKNIVNLEPRVPQERTVVEIEAMRSSQLREFLRDYDHADVIAALGESDLLEVIGVERCLEYVQAVGFGPRCTDRQFARTRVAELAYSFECDTPLAALESVIDALHMSDEEQLDRRERARDIRNELARR